MGYQFISIKKGIQPVGTDLVQRIQGRKILLLNGFSGRRIHLERIDGRAVLPHAEVQVRARGRTGHAHIANHLPLVHAVPYLEARRIFGKVHIAGGIHGIVTDLDGIATAAAPALADDGTVTDAHHGRAGGSGIVYARMGTDHAVHGMQAVIGETGRDAGKLERGLEESLAHACKCIDGGVGRIFADFLGVTDIPK